MVRYIVHLVLYIVHLTQQSDLAVELAALQRCDV